MGFDGRFAYAVGRIRALENRMIDQARFSRMIDAETHEELMRVLGETEFGGDRDVRPGASAYEDLINAELLRVHELVASMSPDPALTGVFRARHDFHNMKALLKAALAARDRGIRAQGRGPGLSRLWAGSMWTPCVRLSMRYLQTAQTAAGRVQRWKWARASRTEQMARATSPKASALP